MSGRIRTAVVGLGGIAAEHFDKLDRIESVEVAGICDLSRTLVDAVGERYGVGPGFTDYGTMLAEVRPDVVHVLSPPQTHRKLVLAALEARAHVFVEKPIAPSFDEYAEMRDAASAAGLLLAENYNYRFMGVVQRALEMVREGQVGEPVNIDLSMGVGLAGATYTDPEIPHFGHSLPGGAMRNFASHPASIAVAVLDGWDTVGVSQRRLTPGLASNDELRALVSGPRVSAGITITSHTLPSSFTFAVQATEATVQVDVLRHRLHVAAGSPATAQITNGIREAIGQLAATASLVRRATTTRDGYFEGFARLLDRFYEAVAGVGASPVTVEDMDATNRLVDAMFDSGNQL